jgi:predicted CopG family antitoxin
MATKTINLTEGAYARLASLKREGESFSQVVDRLTGKFGLLDLIGILDDRSVRELRSVKKDLGKRLRKGMDRSSGR